MCSNFVGDITKKKKSVKSDFCLVKNNPSVSDYYSKLTTSAGTNCIYDLHADQLHQHFPLDISITPGRMICYFKLIALVGHLIRLSVASIQIEADNCITDSLTIYDSLMPIKSKILYR